MTYAPFDRVGEGGEAVVMVLEPTVLEGHGVRVEPLTPVHAEGLALAASDGQLWELRYTFVPEADKVESYISEAPAGQSAGHMLPWAVRELESGEIVGSTRYHDVLDVKRRLEDRLLRYSRQANTGAGHVPSARSRLARRMRPSAKPLSDDG